MLWFVLLLQILDKPRHQKCEDFRGVHPVKPHFFEFVTTNRLGESRDPAMIQIAATLDDSG